MIPVFPLYVLLFQQLFVSSIDYPRNWVHSPYDYLSIYIYPYNWFYDIPISYIKIYHILSIYYHIYIYICIIHIWSILSSHAPPRAQRPALQLPTSSRPAFASFASPTRQLKASHRLWGTGWAVADRHILNMYQESYIRNVLRSEGIIYQELLRWYMNLYDIHW